MFDGSVSLIENDGHLINIADSAATFLIVGRDHNGDLFLTKILLVSSTVNETNWRKITANSVDIICTPDQEFLTTTGWKSASFLNNSDSVYGLSGTSTHSFAIGGAVSHPAIQTQYKNIFTTFAVTANVAQVQTVDAYGLRTTVGKYFANRFLVRDIP